MILHSKLQEPTFKHHMLIHTGDVPHLYDFYGKQFTRGKT